MSPPARKKFKSSSTGVRAILHPANDGGAKEAAVGRRTKGAKHSTPIGKKYSSGGGGTGGMMHATPREEARMRARQRAREWARNTLGSMKREGSRARPLIVLERRGNEGSDPRRFALRDGPSTEGSVEGRMGARTTTNECHTPSLRERMSRIDIDGVFATAEENLESIESIGNEEDVFYDSLEFEYPPTTTAVGCDNYADSEDERRRSMSAPLNRTRDDGESRTEPLEPVGISFSTIVSKPDP
jgi:hypothetical protein